MASIETRVRPKGTSHRVVWYDTGGRKRSETWATLDRAELWKNLIEPVHGDEADAAQHLARQASQSMTLTKVADHRLSLLRATDFTRQPDLRVLQGCQSGIGLEPDPAPDLRQLLGL